MANLITVSGNVTDSDTQPWVSATWLAQLIVPGGGRAFFLDTGAAVTPAVSGQLDSSGDITGSPQLAFTDKIGPAGCQWQVEIASLTSAPAQVLPRLNLPSFLSSPFDLGGFITANITAPRIEAGTLVYAYNDDEVLNPVQGNGYIDTVNGGGFLWNGTEWVATASGGGSGTVNPGAQSALSFYPEAGTSDIVGPSQVTTDTATQSNIRVPGSAVIGSEITLPTGTPQANTTIGLVQPFFVGAGVNLGNLGTWTSQHGFIPNFFSAVRGIRQGCNVVFESHGAGDSAGFYCNLFADGGIAAQSDEGVAAGTFEAIEPGNYFHSTIAGTTGTGDQRPTFNVPTDSIHLGDGTFLLNISKGTVSGKLTGENGPTTFNFETGNIVSFINSQNTDQTTIPLLTAAGYHPGGGSWNGQTRNVGVQVNIELSLIEIGGVFNGFDIGDVVFACGNNYPEHGTIVAASAISAGVQTVGIVLSNPWDNNGIYIFKGGVAGQYISLDANLVLSGMRSSFYCIGSMDGSTILYASNVGGNVSGEGVPIPGSMAATDDGGANSGFHLYPGAEVVANYDGNYDAMLEPNDCPWAVNDVVENPHYPIGAGSGIGFNKIQESPTSPTIGMYGMIGQVQGFGFAGLNTSLVKLANTNPSTIYQAGGGPLTAPQYGFRIEGAFQRLINFSEGPQGDGAFLSLDSYADGNDILVLELPDGTITRNRSVPQWTFTDTLAASGMQIAGTATAQQLRSTNQIVAANFVASGGNGYWIGEPGSGGVQGATGTFLSADAKTVTVNGGIITSIV